MGVISVGRPDPNQPGYLPSNGTEGETFFATNCYPCVKDGFGVSEEGPVCEILNDTLCGIARDEWVHDPSTGWPGNAHCTEFEAATADG